MSLYIISTRTNETIGQKIWKYDCEAGILECTYWEVSGLMLLSKNWQSLVEKSELKERHGVVVVKHFIQ